MNYLVLLATFFCFAGANAAVVPSTGTTTNIQGPSSQSRIVGPDGSVITAQAPGGQIVHEETPGVFETAGHFLGPGQALINPAVPGIAARKAVDAVVAGPSGVIATGQYASKTADDTGSIMSVLKIPNGRMSSIGVES